MIKGNERAIDLGLELAQALFPNQALPQTVLSGLIDYARQLLGLRTQPFRCQDLFYLEAKALRKMRRASKSKTLSDYAERLEASA